MEVEELTRAMRAGEESYAAGPVDLEGIRAGGRRRRRVRRAAVAGCVAATAGVLLAGVALGGALPVGGGGSGTTSGIAAAPGSDRLSPYERRVLTSVPGAFAAGGVVVVPGPVDPDVDWNTRFEDRQLTRPIVPLGFHGYTDPGYIASSVTYPRFMSGALPEDSQVHADNGPVSLTCATWEGAKKCGVALLVGDERVGWFYLYGLGTDDFLTPGSEMELFLETVYDGGVARESVIGGFDGTAATRVELTLSDGSTQDAKLDSGRIATGDTLFWAVTDRQVTKATAYDARGEVVQEHAVRSCTDPVDCEVR